MDLFKLVGSIFVKSEDANEEIDKVKDNAKGLATTVGKSFSDAGEKITSVGKKMLPVTVAIGGLGVSAVKSSAEMKALNSQFEQTFGDLQDDARKALEGVATESGILQTRLQGVGTSIYAFAKSSGADSAEAMSLMEEALRATADASAYYDRSLEDTSESLMSFLKGNFANDAQLGVSCTETTRNAKAMELFGQKYNDLSEIQKQQTLLKMVTDAQKLSGAMGQASRESDGFENVTGNLNESIKILGAEIAEVILPTVVSLTQKATETIQKFSEMDDKTKNLIVTAGLVVGAVAPVLLVGGKLISGIGTIITLTPKVISGAKTIGTGLKALWTIMSANPIGVIITIIGVLVATFIHLWNTSEEFRNFWINVWNSIKNTVSSAINTVKITITDGLNTVKNTVSTILDSIKTKFENIWDNCKSVVSNAIDKIKSIMDFEWSLPKLKLPHVSISGKFSLSPPSVPKFSVEWYKNGGIMTEPTLFGYNPLTNSAMVGGEAGAEAIAPIDLLQGYVAEAVSNQNNMLVTVLMKILDAIVTMDENMGGNLREALNGTSFEINKREFARLVKVVG